MKKTNLSMFLSNLQHLLLKHFELLNHSWLLSNNQSASLHKDTDYFILHNRFISLGLIYLSVWEPTKVLQNMTNKKDNCSFAPYVVWFSSIVRIVRTQSSDTLSKDLRSKSIAVTPTRVSWWCHLSLLPLSRDGIVYCLSPYLCHEVGRERTE